MKNLAQQIIDLKVKEQEAYKAYTAYVAKEANALLKRLGREEEKSYEDMFSTYIHEEYPTDKDGNNMPYKQPSSLSVETLVIIYARELPYVKAKREKWLKLRASLRDAEDAIKGYQKI